MPDSSKVERGADNSEAKERYLLWRPNKGGLLISVAGFERYKITEDGRVFATHLNRFLKPYNNGLGYLAVKLSDGKKRVQKYVHRLVAEAYLGSVYSYDINHKDGDKSNNSVPNLEIVSHRENLQHAFDNKLLRGFVEKHYK